MRALATAVLLAAAPLLAAPSPPASPTGAVRAALTRAQAVVAGEGTRDEKLAALGSIARDLLDTDAMGRTALAGELEDQPEAHQEEFLALFDEVIVRAYLRRLLFFREPEFAYTGERVDGDDGLVETRIVTRKDQYAVDYPMRRRGGGWVATDIVVEGVSLIRNYRAQFASLLRTHSFAELLERMRRKTRVERSAA